MNPLNPKNTSHEFDKASSESKNKELEIPFASYSENKGGTDPSLGKTQEGSHVSKLSGTDKVSDVHLSGSQITKEKSISKEPYCHPQSMDFDKNLGTDFDRATGDTSEIPFSSQNQAKVTGENTMSSLESSEKPQKGNQDSRIEDAGVQNVTSGISNVSDVPFSRSHHQNDPTGGSLA